MKVVAAGLIGLVIAVVSVSASVWPAPNHDGQNSRASTLPGPPTVPVPYCVGSISTPAGGLAQPGVLAGNSTFIVLSFADVNGSAALAVIAYRDCIQLWLTPLQSSGGGPSLFLSADDSMVYTSSGYHNGTIFAVRVEDGSIAWTTSPGVPLTVLTVTSTEVIVQLGSDSGLTVASYAPETGAFLASYLFPTKQVPADATVLVVAGESLSFPFDMLLYSSTPAPAESWMVYAWLLPVPTGQKQLWSTWIPGPATNAVAWIDPRTGISFVAVQTSNGLVVLDGATGNQLWVCTPCDTTGSLAVAAGSGLVVTTITPANGYQFAVVGLNAATGQQSWLFQPSAYDSGCSGATLPVTPSSLIVSMDSSDATYVTWNEAVSPIASRLWMARVMSTGNVGWCSISADLNQMEYANGHLLGEAGAVFSYNNENWVELRPY